MRVVPKQVDTLWTLFTAPVVWALHFLTCYIGAAIWCAKPNLFGVGFEVVRVGIAATTFLALAAISCFGLARLAAMGLRHQRSAA